MNIFLNLLKKFVIIKSLQRTISIYLAFITGRILLFLLGVFNINYKHRKNSNSNPDIILSSQSSVIDWAYLYYTYAPKFLWIVRSDDNLNVII
jgi:hypothetical protein